MTPETAVVWQAAAALPPEVRQHPGSRQFRNELRRTCSLACLLTRRELRTLGRAVGDAQNRGAD